MPGVSIDVPLLPLLTATLLGQASVAPLPEICFDLPRAQRQNDGATMTAESDPARQNQARQALRHAFKRYPAGFLAQAVTTVYVVRSMADDDGAEYGGTPGDDGHSVLITDGDDEGVDSKWTEDVFHHETAHVLLDHNDRALSKRAWREAAAPEFRYAHARDGSYWAIRDGEDDDTFLPELNEQGLLTAYGASCFDEDWAVYAMNVLDPSPEFSEIVRRYPRVARRAALVESFYEKVVPGWSPSPFGTSSSAEDKNR